ncbi:MAG: hypothetical protein LBR81_06355 [Prevotellaceae bacterium]|jgi:hypothetical protein|nr:hypothetical protein [Prevotellaceae bacterium]
MKTITILKNKFIKCLLSIFFIVTGFFLAVGLNIVLYKIIIGDPCHWHNVVDTNFVFDLFYEISSNTGYHPEPTFFNLIFTLLFGILLGLFLSYKIVWKKKKS